MAANYKHPTISQGSEHGDRLPQPPQSESKAIYDTVSEDEDEILNNDANLASAVTNAVPEVVKAWREGELLSVAEAQLETHRAKLMEGHNLEIMTKAIRKHYLAKETDKKKAETFYDTNQHNTKMLSTFIDQAFELIKDPGKEDSRQKQQADRVSINRVIKLINRNASLYDLLEVTNGASTDDIQKAWRKAVKKIHPDGNEDTSANRCTQALNSAKDVLVNAEKRARYDKHLADNAPEKLADEFGEEFSPNAYGDDGNETDGFDSDLEGVEETPYPKPPTSVRDIHERMTPYITKFFSHSSQEVRKDSRTSLLKANRQIGRKVRDWNKDYVEIKDLYQFPLEKLCVFRKLYSDTLISVQVETIAIAQDRLASMAGIYQRISAQSLYQWPDSWLYAMTGPLHEIINQRDQPPTDADMPDLPSSEGGDTNGIDDSIRPSPRRIQDLRVGYTVLGDKILGYEPIQRWSKAMRENIILGWIFFIQIEGTNPLKYATGSEVGDQQALAYHQLPDTEKYDVRNSISKYRQEPSDEFEGIKGVTYRPNSASDSRLPDTWVLVGKKSTPGAIHILTRSALRAWLSKPLADKYIDDFLVENDIHPPWALLDFDPDPANESRYLTLQYPAPRRNSSVAYSTRSRSLAPSSAVTSNEMHALSSKFDKLLEMLIEDRKEQQEERKLNRELMMRLLPG